MTNGPSKESIRSSEVLLYDDRDCDPGIGYSLADEVMKEDWEDPMMAEYDRYEEYTRPKETSVARPIK